MNFEDLDSININDQPVNKRFAEYATSTAFSISLTKLQCNALLRHMPGQTRQPLSIATLQQLEARGLVSWTRDERGFGIQYNGLTPAGRIMVSLLQQAGLTVENTNTLSTMRRAA